MRLTVRSYITGGSFSHGLKSKRGTATLSFRRALNLRRHSTVSCLCIMEATVERCCRRNKTITGHPQLEHFKRVTSGGAAYADPGVFEGLLSSDSLGRVDGQHLVDQVLRLWRHCVPLWGWKLRRKTGQGGRFFSFALPLQRCSDCCSLQQRSGPRQDFCFS